MTQALTSALALAALVLPSCGLGTHYFLDEQELTRFRAAGPVLPEIDTTQILSGLAKPGPYKVVAGDLLEIHAPRTLFLDQADPGTVNSRTGVHLTRVSDDGKIIVPMAGSIQAGGKTLDKIESAIANATFPKYLRRRPSIVATIAQHQTRRVTVVGAVEKPGIVELKSDELSLFSALQASGGIIKPGQLVLGAKMIRIKRPGDTRKESMMLPVKGLSIPVGDVVLAGGETIEVELYQPDTFTVLGLVAKANVYPRPTGSKFNLMDALATAGGTDLAANPPYATIFRQDASGTILPGTFQINGEGIREALELTIKPGDVIVVAHTPASWTRSVLSQAVRLQFGYVANQAVID